MEDARAVLNVTKEDVLVEDGRKCVLLYSVIFFTTLYATAWLFIFRSWREHKRCRACSSCISFFHALIGASMAMTDMVRTPWKLDAPNTALQNKIMDWSMAYFIVDLVHYFVAVPEDHLFIGHHLTTLTYMLSCRYYTRHGAKSAISLIAAGEATTPLQAIWTLARLGKDEFPLAERIYNALSPVFTLLFTVVRGLLGPFLLRKLGSFYLTGGADHVIPRWLVCCWMSKVTFAVIGSMVWVFKLWKGLLKFYSQRGGIRSIWKRND